jgi:phosphoribosylaminoimidazole (AIR) synthetase
VKGQPNWDIQSSSTATKGGIESEAAGYVLFRYIDLSAAGVTLKQQDRIIKMGHIDTDVYIIGLKPIGHYQDQNGASLVKAFFTDRAPSRGVPEHQ